MKYFTPELYLRYNATDDREADQAEEAWDRAIAQYKRYLKDHRSKMPANVRTLAEKCSLHDAALLGWQTHPQRSHQKSASRDLATLGLQNADETIVLCYFLLDAPKEKRRPKNWPFSGQRKHWLYDEVAVNEKENGNNFVHRILWSDGSELEIPFEDLIIDRFPSLTVASA